MESAHSRDARTRLQTAPPHSVRIPVLGIPVRFEAEEPGAITAVSDAFAAWRGVEHIPRLVAAVEPARVRIFRDADPGEDEDFLPDLIAPVYDWPDHERLIVRAGTVFGCADARRRDVLLFAGPSRLADPHGFRADFLEPLVLAMLGGPDRVPVRAAAIEYGEIAMILAGPPGTGKSTLACAAALSGFRVLADNVVHVQLAPRFRVWGLPGFIHLPVSSARFFPDVAVAAPRMGFGDRERIALNVRELNAMPALPVAQQAAVCVLVPSEGDPEITALGAGDLESLLLRTQTRDAASEMFAEPVHVLSRHGGWVLEIGSDPNAAVELLRQTLDGLLSG